MNEQMGLLIQLQRIDTHLSKFNEKEQHLRRKIETENQALEALKNKLREARSQLEKTASEKKEKEKDVEIQEQLVQKTQSRLKDIKTNKEYQAHLNEIDALKKGRGAQEEVVLLLMDKMEVLKNEVELQETEFKEKEARFLQMVEEIEKEISKLLEEKGQFEEERNKVSGRVTKKIMAQYEHLLASKKRTAIVPLNGATCLGCHMNLPPQLIAEVKRNDKMLTCSYCYRILYWQEIYFPKTA
ncbi:MAG: zinc ribbon domain-containing protein [Nitrospiria bacterium]